jgi:hypothetical protein
LETKYGKWCVPGIVRGLFDSAGTSRFTAPEGATTLVKGGWLGVMHTYPVEMAQNFWTAIFACASATLITVTVSLVTKRNKTDEELIGLVYSLTPKISEKDVPWYKRTNTLALLVLVIFIYFICLILVKKLFYVRYKNSDRPDVFRVRVIVLIYGFMTRNDAELYQKSLSHNVNLWMGGLMLVFGG